MTYISPAVSQLHFPSHFNAEEEQLVTNSLKKKNASQLVDEYNLQSRIDIQLGFHAFQLR